jgi:hypothetical protein
MKKEIPILFSTSMVQAIMEGRKTMTRRVVKFSLKCPTHHISIVESDSPPIVSWAKWQPGNILWVRESFCRNVTHDDEIIYKASQHPNIIERLSWKPSIHMPKDVCRIWLEVTNVRVERLHEITEEDARAEGVRDLEPVWPHDFSLCRKCGGTGLHETVGPNLGMIEVDCTNCDTYKKRFNILWNKINGEESWNANPWVWIIEFKVLSTTGKPTMPNDPNDERIATQMGCHEEQKLVSPQQNPKKPD